MGATLKENVAYIKIAASADYSIENLRKVVRSIDIPLDPKHTDGDNQMKKWLKKQCGWTQPRMLIAYTEKGFYKDLFVYFDYGNKRGKVNKIATHTFKMYGLDAKQAVMDWSKIRGDAVMCRADPPTSEPSEIRPPYDAVLSRQEIIDTILFFKDKNPAKVCRERDMERMWGPEMRMMAALGIPLPAYRGGRHGLTKHNILMPEQIERIIEKACANCHIPKPMVKKLMICPCKSAYYCGKDCQRSHWKVHKQNCAWQKKKKQSGE